MCDVVRILCTILLHVIPYVDAEFDEKTYGVIMELAGLALKDLGNQAKQNDLTTNIAVFITWQLSCETLAENSLGYQLSPYQMSVCNSFVESQLFVFTSLAQNVFEISNSVSSMANKDNYCNATSTTGYSVVSAVSEISYDYEEFLANPSCSGIVDPEIFGYDDVLHNNDFSIDIDVRTFGDSIGVNFGYLLAIELETVGNAESNTITFSYQGVDYTTDPWIDPVYQGMLPMYCITNASAVVDKAKGMLV